MHLVIVIIDGIRAYLRLYIYIRLWAMFGLLPQLGLWIGEKNLFEDQNFFKIGKLYDPQD